MLLMLLMVHAQIGIEAGPVQISCGGSVVTLAATPVNPPANYSIQWEDAVQEGVFLVVSPSETTSYRVFLTDLDTMTVYEDLTWVNVHPGDPDLVDDDQFTAADRLALIGAWGGPVPDPDFDPDGDGQVSVLDYFYFCDHDAEPPNTPPTLTVSDFFTTRNEAVEVDYTIMDAEQTPSLIIASPPANGTAFLLGGVLQYVPDVDYTGADSFELQVTDGILTTPPVTVQVDVLQPDTWNDLYLNIFFIRCKACHIDAVSGGLSLSSYLSAQAGGDSGAGFVGGFPELSPIYLRVADGTMPQGQAPLSQSDIDRIYNWILRGAPNN